MGYNTVALFLNDQADSVRRHHKPLGDGLYRCMASGVGSEERRDIYLPGQTMVLPSQHADTLQIIIAGGNTIRFFGHAHRTQFDDDESILRALANQRGFQLVRKAKRATNSEEK